MLVIVLMMRRLRTAGVLLTAIAVLIATVPCCGRVLTMSMAKARPHQSCCRASCAPKMAEQVKAVTPAPPPAVLPSHDVAIVRDEIEHAVLHFPPRTENRYFSPLSSIQLRI
jgi:hypothetical protein